MTDAMSPVDHRLLDDFQRDLPLVSRPFARLADLVGLDEAGVITRLKAHKAAGRIARVGATVRPNTVGASTLAALAVPPSQIDEVATIVNACKGVNHSYLREHDWNLWFVVTAPDIEQLDTALAKIARETGLELLDLRLIRPFNIDLGFSLTGGARKPMTRPWADISCLRVADRPLLHALSQGLPLVPRPWAALGRRLGWGEREVLDRTDALLRADIISRLGVIVRHRAVGWSANAMVVWDVPDDRMEEVGTALAACPGITLCYQRRRVPGLWRYGLFSMIHARTRPEALAVRQSAAALPQLAGIDHLTLFSLRCFKQTGAQIMTPTGKVA